VQGKVTFTVPDQRYKVRVDYLGGQYWSEPFQWQDREVVIDEGLVDLHVTWNGVEVNGAPVYLFTDTGTYLSRSVTTDPQGHAQFQVPVKAYKFRIDYNGQQYWTGVITPIAHQSLAVEVPLEQLALMPTNNPNPTRYDGEPPVFKREPVRIASIGSLVGILSHAVIAQVAQPKVYYYITDHLGTPQKVVDGNGGIVWSGDYRPFGEVSSGVSKIQNAFRFPGQYHDQETGLHYNYHRYYQPRMGRYLTPDPMGQDGGINLYSYVENNPINGTDPLGMEMAGGAACERQTKTCVGIALFSAIGPQQALDPGALATFGVHPNNGTVAVSPTIFGLPFPEGQNLTRAQLRQREETQRALAQVAGQITIIPQGLQLHGGPVPPYTVGDIGDIIVRQAPIPQFDIYRFPSRAAARRFGIQDVPTIITIPAELQCPPGFQEQR
jgi:RHS repeat-associated protein